VPKKLKFIIESAAEKFPHRPALIGTDRQLSYREYWAKIRRTWHNLQEAGISAATPVALLARSDFYLPILLLSLLYGQAVAVPLDPRLPENLLAAYLKKLNIRRLITNQAHALLSENIILLNPEALINAQPFLNPNIKTDQWEADAGQAATVVLTSGSSAEAKAVLHSYGNHYFSALGSNRNIRLLPGDRWLLSLPLFHVSGISILFRAALAGAAVAIPRQGTSLEAAVAQFRPSHLSVVSTQLRRLLDSSTLNETLALSKAILVGGSAIPRALLRTAYRRHWSIFVSYGSTEMSSQITTTGRNSNLDELFTAGRLLPYRKLRISADSEIQVQGATLFKGYLQGHTLHRPTDKQGWFKTGDLGFLDRKGRLVVRGRKDRMFISGGENIYPEEIEAALLDISEIKQALVLPVADAVYGMRPAAVVDSSLSAQTMVKGLRKKLPKFKIPDYFLAWPADPAQELKIKPSFFERYVLQQVHLNTKNRKKTNEK